MAEPSLHLLVFNVRPARLIFSCLIAGVCLAAAQAPTPPVETPPAKDPSKAVLRFAVYGDTRDGHDTHRAIIADVMSKQPGMVLQTGDLVSDSSIAAQWSIFEEITGKMRTAIPYYPARGNHDNQGGEFFQKYVPKEGVHREGFYYSFEVGSIHFVAVDTEESLVVAGAQYLWLDADMKAARAADRFIIPFYHKATYSVGSHATQRAIWEMRPVLHDLFRKYGVLLVFQGHDHIYYRTVRDGITYVVTAGGGAPLYGLDHTEIGIPGDVYESVNHFCIGDVFEDRVEVTAYRVDLSVLDTITIVIPPGQTPLSRPVPTDPLSPPPR